MYCVTKSRIVAGAVLLMVAACGHVSDIQPGHYENQDRGYKGKPYKHVVVEEFINNDEEGMQKYAEAIYAGHNFAEAIKRELQVRGIFTTVTRHSDGSDALVVAGDIIRYRDNSPLLQLMIGFFGNAQLDANVRFYDSRTGTQLGSIEVDKNSWLPGGVISAFQDIDSLMRAAAKKIASEIETHLYTTLANRNAEFEPKYAGYAYDDAANYSVASATGYVGTGNYNNGANNVSGMLRDNRGVKESPLTSGEMRRLYEGNFGLKKGAIGTSDMDEPFYYYDKNSGEWIYRNE